MNEQLVIYKITNKINGHIYIGQTNNFEHRKNNHIKTAQNKWKGYERPLYQAMIKYGIENFEFEIIDTATTYDELNEKEIYYIEYYQSSIDYGKGYNLDLGGHNGRKSEYVKRKIGGAQIGELNHMYGKKFELCANSKPMINETTGVKYVSLRQCALKEYGTIEAVKQISKVCDPYSNRFTYNGQVYKLLDENGNPIDKKVKPIKAGPKKIYEAIHNKIYLSFSDASRDTGLSTGAIRDRVYGRIKNDKYKGIYDFKLYENEKEVFED